MTAVAFTICAKNYLSRARVCLESFREQHPDVSLYLFLSDEDDQGYRPEDEAFPVVLARDLNLPSWGDMVLRYDVTELSTAIKPACFARLFSEGYDHIVYLDPDTYVVGVMSEVLEPLMRGQADAVVTPHITQPIEDDLTPSDGDMLRVGVFNLGFLALRRSQEVQRFVGWWDDKLRFGAVSDLAAGLFTDQKWCDLLPCFIGRTLVLRHPGYNVAYWNLMHRPVARDGSRWTAAGENLVLAHFSGYDPTKPKLISKHQQRFTAANAPGFATLGEAYGAKVLVQAATLPPYHYSYDVGPDGRPLAQLLRELYRRAAPNGGPTDARAALVLAESFARQPEPAFRGLPGPVVTRVMYAAWRRDNALTQAWNLEIEADRTALARWFQDSGAAAENVAHLAAPPEDEALQPSTGRRGGVSLLNGKALLRTALERYQVLAPIYRLLPVGLRQNIRATAMRMAFGGRGSTQLRRRLDTRLRPGASLIGYARGELGMGEHVRMTAAALISQEIDCSIVDIGRHVLARSQDRRFDALIVPEPRHRASIYHVNADQLPEVRREIGAAGFDGRLNIAYPAWELSEFPDPWIDAFDAFDEIWAPSRFIQSAISAKVAKRVLYMPLAVSLAEGYSAWTRADFGLPDDEMIFLFYFDLASYAARKNPQAALEAFRRAFPEPESGPGAPRLVIKTLSSERYPNEMAALRAAIGDRADVTLITETLEASAIHGLVNCCDVFVSLHRSEGFGRAPAEAMAAGKGVIATAYSGNAEYMNPANSEPIPYTLVPVQEGAYLFGEGQVWAEPDLDAAAAAMRAFRANPDLVSAKGEAARRYMAEHHSPHVIGALYKRRLSALGVLSS
ncbi:MAG: glycosyltransferase [Caulobacter sp.]|nr:glycosyltransferase [Caulobacter sp.]